MVIDSIRSILTLAQSITTIRLLLSADINKNKSFIVVEGMDDVKFFRDKIDKEVEIIESYSGKIGVFSIINEVNDSRVIGICDRDYDKEVRIPRIFYYDYANLEMMLISNDVAFMKLIAENYEVSSFPFDLRYEILCGLQFLSLIRKYNEDFNAFIRFGTDMPIDTLVIKGSFELNKHKTKCVLLERNQADNLAITEAIRNAESLCQTKLSYENLLFITQGHDFAKLLQHVISNGKIRSGKTQGSDSLISSMRCAYYIDHFRVTGLYYELYEYTKKHNIKLIQLKNTDYKMFAV